MSNYYENLTRYKDIKSCLSELNAGDHIFLLCKSDMNESMLPAIVWKNLYPQENKLGTLVLGVPSLSSESSGWGSFLTLQYTKNPTIITNCKIKSMDNTDETNDAFDIDIGLYKYAALTVETPEGTLLVEDKLDAEYPGVWVSLLHDDKQTTLATVEYIVGGEGLADNSSNKSEMERQKNEVPDVRRTKDDDGDVVATAGMVTRAWPNEHEDPDFHYRTFHYGYTSD